MPEDPFNDAATSARAEQPRADLSKTPFPTKEKLLHLIAEQKRALERMEPAPRPAWAEDANDEQRQAYRRISRALRRTETRLDKAVQGFEREFDWHS